MLEHYALAQWALLLILLTLLAQLVVAATSKARQPGAIPGKMDASLSHDSFVFRANRTVANSLENMPLLVGAAFLAMLAGVSPAGTAACLWVFAIARLVHMALYYAIATEQNPSPRSYFYLIGLLANAVLLVLIGLALV